LPAQKRKRPRGVVDTSVLVAGIAGLKSLDIPLKNPSAKLLRDWIEKDTFVWLVTDEIVLEYKQILARLSVRRPLIGRVIDLLREEAEFVAVPLRQKSLPIQETIPFAPALKLEALISL